MLTLDTSIFGCESLYRCTKFMASILILMVTGTTFNYFLDDRINRAEILFPGVGCFVIAVCLASAVHSSNAADNKAKLKNLSSDHKGYVSFCIVIAH